VSVSAVAAGKDFSSSGKSEGDFSMVGEVQRWAEKDELAAMGRARLRRRTLPFFIESLVGMKSMRNRLGICPSILQQVGVFSQFVDDSRCCLGTDCSKVERSRGEEEKGGGGEMAAALQIISAKTSVRGQSTPDESSGQ
jgi:hypothetical protein